MICTARNYDLDSLKSREQIAFQRKQLAFRHYQEVRNLTSGLHAEMESAWQERVSAREVMNREYDEMQKNGRHYEEVWDEYGCIRDQNNARIESLKQEADCEHREMIRCFERASSEYEYGDRSMAPIYSQEGYQHRDRRDELNAEVSRLGREVKEAKQDAKRRAPKTDSSAYREAKCIFERAKARHKFIETEFKRAKAEQSKLKAEFNSLHTEHLRLKEELNRERQAAKSKQASEERQTIEKVNMALVHSKARVWYFGTIFGQNAKIVPRHDGSHIIDVYFGGLHPAGDGIGHGHAIIDAEGNVTYLRDAWVDRSSKDNYLIDDKADKYGKDTHKI